VPAAKRKVKFVRFIDAMKCRGLSPSVALLPPALVCESPSISYSDLLVVDRLVSSDIRVASAPLSIDPPRPKVALPG
jgi:hypothetical protein